MEMKDLYKKRIVEWLSAENGGGKKLIDFRWKISEENDVVVLNNEKVPFTLKLSFDEMVVRIFVDTLIETAVLDLEERLRIYRSLLLLNYQIDLVKFMLSGMNENIFARVDLDLKDLTRKELGDALDLLLSALFKMVKTLGFEDQFNKQIVERMIETIIDLREKGKSKEQIVDYLVQKIGFVRDDARKIVGEILVGEAGNMEGMYK